MSKAIQLNPRIWYYLLRVKLANTRLERSKYLEESEEQTALLENLYYWQNRSKQDSYPNTSRHHCTHTRHSRLRESHHFQFGPFRYNHYPLRAEHKDPAYFILPWGSGDHHAVDVAFKWNLYCFAVTMPLPHRRSTHPAEAELQDEPVSEQ